MWGKIKEAIFHQVVKRGTVSAAAVAVAFLSKPAIMASLAAAGVTIDAAKFSTFIIIALSWLIAMAGHYLESKVSGSPVNAVSK